MTLRITLEVCTPYPGSDDEDRLTVTVTLGDLEIACDEFTYTTDAECAERVEAMTQAFGGPAEVVERDGRRGTTIIASTWNMQPAA